MSEIDFAQCRKCTPSYRSLPKNYPKPLCSERSEAEALVLNDEWVSKQTNKLIIFTLSSHSALSTINAFTPSAHPLLSPSVFTLITSTAL